MRGRRFLVALDSCHGAGSTILPELLERLGCEVCAINLLPDGLFHRPPEPVAENLGELQELVRSTGAAVGLAVDPDVDRLALVDETGRAIGEDFTLALACRVVLRRQAGLVVTNLSTSRVVDDVAAECGSSVIRAPVGEVNVAARMRDVGAVIGGEGNGGVILPELHLGRDAPVAAALVLQLLLEDAPTAVSDRGTLSAVRHRQGQARPAGRGPGHGVRRPPRRLRGRRGRHAGRAAAQLAGSLGACPAVGDGADRPRHRRGHGRRLRPGNSSLAAARLSTRWSRSYHFIPPMCGIVGYVGPRAATPLLIEGLKRLEYRGYDSAGVAIMNGAGVETVKEAGKISRLESLAGRPSRRRHDGHRAYALGDARVAEPGERASARQPGWHHRASCITASSRTPRRSARCWRSGATCFTSETDTEVLAHLIEEFFDGNLEDAVIQALRQVEGTYGIAVISSVDSHKIVAARKGSPLLVGLGDDEYFVASDVSAILAHTRQVVYLDDGEMAVLDRNGYRIIDLNATEVEKKVVQDRLGPRADRARRFRALHAQGDLRAAADDREHDARSVCCSDEGTSKLGGLNLTDDELLVVRQHRDHRLRHELALGAHRRAHDRGADARAGGGGVRVRVPLPQSRSSTSARCAS